MADPNGQLVKEASGEDEELLLCSVDLSLAAAARDSFSFPFRDRRIDSYAGLTQRFLDNDG